MGNGRSVWPESPGLHAAYNGQDNESRARKGKVIPETYPQFGLRVVTHPHEVGIPSNRASLSRGELVPASCTHRPSSQLSGVLVSPSSSRVVDPRLREGG